MATAEPSFDFLPYSSLINASNHCRLHSSLINYFITSFIIIINQSSILMIDYCTISTFLIYSTPLGLLIILEHCTCNSMYFLHLAFGRTTLEAVPPRKRLSAKIVSRAHLPRIVHLAYHHLGLFNGVCAWCAKLRALGALGTVVANRQTRHPGQAETRKSRLLLEGTDGS